MMHRMLVDEKKWIDEPRFLHALNFCMLLPGPEAQKLATYIGWALHGVRGGLVAGILFVLPGALVMLGLSLAYALGRGIAWIDGALFGIKAAVLVIVVEALLRIGRRALKTRLLIALAGAAFVGIFFLNAPFPLIVAGAALIGYLVARSAPRADGPEGRGRRHSRPLRRTAGGSSSSRPSSASSSGGRRSRSRRSRSAPPRAGEHRHVLLQARGGELRRRLRAARLHGAAGGRDASLDDRARNGRRARPRRDHAGAAHPGDAVRRLSRGVPRRRAVLAGRGGHSRRRDDHVGDVHALDAVDLRRRAVRRATARQPPSVRRARGDHGGGGRRDPQPHGLVRAACAVRPGRRNACRSVPLLRVRSALARPEGGGARRRRGGAGVRPAPQPDRDGRRDGGAGRGDEIRARAHEPSRPGRGSARSASTALRVCDALGGSSGAVTSAAAPVPRPC